MKPLVGGPDAARYIYLSQGTPVPRPFHLRWLAPWLCRMEAGRWWALWGVSWVMLAGSLYWWADSVGFGWQRAVAVVVVVCGLPGILGPRVVIPIGVDLPATALAAFAVAHVESGESFYLVNAVILVLLAGCVKESAPVFAAVWAWNPILLVGLLAPAVRALVAKPGPDPLGEKFQAIADHPLRAALEAHRGKWRNGWLMVAPWGVCLVALYRPSWPVVVALVLAYGQLLVATDTVRLVHHAAGPVLAFAAVGRLPVEWLLLACVVHVAWWWQMERV